MKCKYCAYCGIEQEFIDAMPDNKTFQRFEIRTWHKGAKEQPFCLLQDFFTEVDPEKDCCPDKLKTKRIRKSKVGKYD